MSDMNNTIGQRRNKHLILDQAKLKRAQKVLGAKTETEAVERALRARSVSEDGGA
jgi:hypothetical protein